MCSSTMCSATSLPRQGILRALERVACQRLGTLISQFSGRHWGALATDRMSCADVQHITYCMHRIMYGEQARFFDDEIHPTMKHTKKGLVAMAGVRIFQSL